MQIFIIFIFIIIAIVITVVRKSNHEQKIHDEIDSMGGTVIDIEHKMFLTGPFILVGKGETVYRIKYEIGDSKKEGWVKFGSIFGPKWRL